MMSVGAKDCNPSLVFCLLHPFPRDDLNCDNIFGLAEVFLIAKVVFEETFSDVGVSGYRQATLLNDLLDHLRERHLGSPQAAAALGGIAAYMKKTVDVFTWGVDIEDSKEMVSAVHGELNAAEQNDLSKSLGALVPQRGKLRSCAINSLMRIMVGDDQSIDAAPHVSEKPVPKGRGRRGGFSFFGAKVERGGAVCVEVDLPPSRARMRTAAYLHWC